MRRVLFREYDLANTISGVRGSKVITGGTGAYFTDLVVGAPIEFDNGTFLGFVEQINNDGELILDRVSLWTFSDENYWIDWTMFVISTGAINRRIESDMPGEANIQVYDNVDASFYLGDMKYYPKYLQQEGEEPILATITNPVKKAFARNLDSRKRFLIRIKESKFDYLPAKRLMTANLKDIVNENGEYIVALTKGIISKMRFEGMIDFSSIKSPVYYDGEVEISFEKNFQIMDKLSALNTIALTETRTGGKFKPDIIGNVDYENVRCGKNAGDDNFWLYYYNDTVNQSLTNANTPEIGTIIRNYQSGTDKYILLTFKAIDTSYFPEGCAHYCGISNYGLYKSNSGDWGRAPQNYDFLYKLFAGEDIYIYQDGVTKTLRKYNGTTFTATGREIIALNAVALLKAILKNKWPDLEFVNNLKNTNGTSLNSVPMQLDFVFQLLNSLPLDKEPLDAVKTLTSAMQCYLYTDIFGRFVIDNRQGWGANGQYADVVQILEHASLKKLTRNEFDDKLVDAVQINVSSWIPDPDNDGEYFDGVGYAYKKLGIKPRNKLTKDVVPDILTLQRYGFTINADATLSYPGLSGQANMLNKYGDLMAAEYLTIYGSRHSSYDAEEVSISWERMDWDLMHAVDKLGVRYFLSNIKEEESGDGSFKMIEVDGHDYNLETVVVGVNPDEQ